MVTADINYIAVLVAAVVSMILGMIWYGPLFGKTWMKESGMTTSKINASKKKGRMYALAFLGSLLTSYVLAHFVDYVQATDISAAAQLGVWIWAGFTIPLLLGSVLWEGKSVKLYLLNVGYHLVSLAMMASILVTLV